MQDGLTDLLSPEVVAAADAGDLADDVAPDRLRARIHALISAARELSDSCADLADALRPIPGSGMDDPLTMDFGRLRAERAAALLDEAASAARGTFGLLDSAYLAVEERGHAAAGDPDEVLPPPRVEPSTWPDAFVKRPPRAVLQEDGPTPAPPASAALAGWVVVDPDDEAGTGTPVELESALLDQAMDRRAANGAAEPVRPAEQAAGSAQARPARAEEAPVRDGPLWAGAAPAQAAPPGDGLGRAEDLPVRDLSPSGGAPQAGAGSAGDGPARAGDLPVRDLSPSGGAPQAEAAPAGDARARAEAGPVPGRPVPDGPVPDGPVPDGPLPDGPLPDGPVREGPLWGGAEEAGAAPTAGGPLGGEPLPVAERPAGTGAAPAGDGLAEGEPLPAGDGSARVVAAGMAAPSMLAAPTRLDPDSAFDDDGGNGRPEPAPLSGAVSPEPRSLTLVPPLPPVPVGRPRSVAAERTRDVVPWADEAGAGQDVADLADPADAEPWAGEIGAGRDMADLADPADPADAEPWAADEPADMADPADAEPWAAGGPVGSRLDFVPPSDLDLAVPVVRTPWRVPESPAAANWPEADPHPTGTWAKAHSHWADPPSAAPHPPEAWLEADPHRAEPHRAEPHRAGPHQAEPDRTGPYQAEPRPTGAWALAGATQASEPLPPVDDPGAAVLSRQVESARRHLQAALVVAHEHGAAPRLRALLTTVERVLTAVTDLARETRGVLEPGLADRTFPGEARFLCSVPWERAALVGADTDGDDVATPAGLARLLRALGYESQSVTSPSGVAGVQVRSERFAAHVALVEPASGGRQRWSGALEWVDPGGASRTWAETLGPVELSDEELARRVDELLRRCVGPLR